MGKRSRTAPALGTPELRRLQSKWVQKLGTCPCKSGLSELHQMLGPILQSEKSAGLLLAVRVGPRI